MAEGENPGMDVRTTGHYLKLRGTHAHLKTQHATVVGENERLKDDLAKRDGELAKLRESIDQNRLLKENQALKGEVRDMRHWQTLETELRNAGIRPEAITTLRKLGEYKAEADEPDPEVVKAFVDSSKQKYAYMFNDQQPNEPDHPKPGPAGGQGGRNREGGKFEVTSAQLADPIWSYENSERIKAAQRNDTLRVIE